MEVADVEHLMDKVLGDSLTDLERIVAVLNDLILVGYGIPLHIGHGKDALRRQLVIDSGARDLVFVFDAILFKELGVLCLNTEVELFLRYLFELFDHGDQIDHLIFIIGVGDNIDKTRELFEDLIILAHHIRDQGTLYLGDDRGAVLEHGVMHLTHRGGAERFVTELLIQFVDLLAGLLLDDRLGDFGIEGLDIPSELFELGAICLGEQIDTAGHDLSDLDVGRTEILQRRAQLLGSEAVGVVVMRRKDAQHLGAAGPLLLAIILDLVFEQLLHLRAHFLAIALIFSLNLIDLLLEILFIDLFLFFFGRLLSLSRLFIFDSLCGLDNLLILNCFCGFDRLLILDCLCGFDNLLILNIVLLVIRHHRHLPSDLSAAKSKPNGSR